MSQFTDDIRYGLRTLVRSPGFSAVVIVTLALGIGFNTAIFGIVNATLLRPLPFAEPDRLVVVWESRSGSDINYMFAAPPNYADWRAQSRSVAELGAFSAREFVLLEGDRSQRVQGARVSYNLFRTLGVQPVRGRDFTLEEEDGATPRVALISDRLWRSRFAADPSIIGRTLPLDDGTYEIVGVMPANVAFPPAIDLEGHAVPRRTDIWTPLGIDLASASRGAHFLTVVGRLAPRATMHSAETELRALAAEMGRQYPATNREWSVRLVPFERVVVGNIRESLLVLLAAVAFVLLIACVNVANLMLSRSAVRQREYAMRAALGAGRGRLIRHTIIESQVLAIAGGAVGVLLAAAASSVLRRFAPPEIPLVDTAWIDATVVAYAFIVAATTGFVFSTVPALRTHAPGVASLLHQAGRGSAGPAQGRLRAALTVSQIALSLMLLAGAGLLVRSFLALRAIDTGIVAENVVTMRVMAPGTAFNEPVRVQALFSDLEQRLISVPTVVAAGFTRDVPLAADFQGTSISVSGFVTSDEERARTHFTAVTPGYFGVMGIPVFQGRSFSAQDGFEASRVAVINQVLARRIFGDRDPLGHQVILFGPRTIVGVVGDVRLEKITDEPRPIVYLPHSQMADDRTLSLVIRGGSDGVNLIQLAQRVIREVAPVVATYDARPMRHVLSDSVAQPRFAALLLLLFSCLALALASVGIYGVISYSVTRRTREIGVRIAVGARPADALRLVLREGLLLALIGIGLGILGALATARFLAALLFGAPAIHAPTLLGVAVFMLAVAALASLAPALRASRVAPMMALREE